MSSHPLTRNNNRYPSKHTVSRKEKKILVYPKGKTNRYSLLYVGTIAALYLWQMMGRSESERSR